MKNKHYFLKMIIFSLGLFIMALGVALSVKANLGVSPISCIPYVISLKIPFTLGTLTIVFNTLLIALQIIILRRNYRLIQLVQLPVVFAFGVFIDIALHLVSNLEISNYMGQAFWCLTSCVLMGLGVFLEVKANLTYLPGEGLALAIAETFKKEFGKAKIGVDSSMVSLGVLSSFVLLHQLLGIREGTIAAAILVGFLAKFFNKNIHVFDAWFEQKTPTDKSSAVIKIASKNNLIITISREYGSGGHEIGKLLAEKWGLSFYDKELIDLTTRKSGFTPEYIQKNEQKLTHSLVFELYEQNYAYVNENYPSLDALFLVQSKIIREICATEPCVIVGRCANFILKDHQNTFNVFIHANKDYRKLKISERSKITSEITDNDLEKIDKERANYCCHYTGENWNNASNYHLTIDSSKYNVKDIVEIITHSILPLKNKITS